MLELLIKKRPLINLAVPVILLLIARVQVSLYSVGFVFVLVGMAVRIWSAGTIVKQEELATGGPYAYVRNPLYLGSLLMAVGYGYWWLPPVLVVLFLIIYWPTIRREEAYLASRYGAAYAEYCGKVPRLIPRLTPASSELSQFTWRQFMNNSELVGVLGGILFSFLFYVKPIVLGWCGQ